MPMMDADAESVMQLIRDLGPPPTGPVDLSEEYLRNVTWLESLPCNQNGSDKSWVWEGFEMDRLHFERARQA
jgi:hypothetical protein